MKFSKTCKIAKTLAKKANRFGRDNAELVGETIYATNGKSIAMVKVQLDDDDTDGVLTAASLSEATKGSRGDASIIANGSLVVETKAGPVTMPRPSSDSVNFPNWRLVVDSAPEEGIKLGLDAKLLYELAQSLGASDHQVTLTLPDPKGDDQISGAIRVTPAHSPDAKGIIMPILTR